MNEIEFENKLCRLASEMEYPQTPDIASSVMIRLRPSNRPRFISRRLALILTFVFFLLSSLILVPTVRAAIIEFIQIGVVRIFPQTIEPTSEAVITATPENFTTPSATLGTTKLPTPTVEVASLKLIPFLDQIAGETNLDNAQQIAPYPILLPTFPADLGQPNHVYVQDADGVMTILVWVDPEQPEQVTMSLHFIPAGHWAINKFGPVVIQDTTVNDQSAIWAEGPYPFLLRNGRLQVDRLINGHVLIWASGDLTYRLETDLTLDKAIKIAESLEPIP